MDGAHMKPPATGHILTAVGLDSNNGMYPVAYAMVEQEKYNSWSWFLELLGDDLGLTRQSNFTFISDRQKGLLQAVARMYPCAEHRFCLRHIHENMKRKGFNGEAYKKHLWKCASATTVCHFEKAMLDLKGFSKECHTYLSKIPPSPWSKSHFSGRAKSDVLLNNICEVLNRWLLDARDKPIITALEYVREYLMKRIVKNMNRAAKSDGPLTPTATKLFELIKKDANHCTVLWSGSNLYQVNGPHGEQCVVDIDEIKCACRKWEITGIPFILIHSHKQLSHLLIIIIMRVSEIEKKDDTKAFLAERLKSPESKSSSKAAQKSPTTSAQRTTMTPSKRPATSPLTRSAKRFTRSSSIVPPASETAETSITPPPSTQV
ncbi:uncharacterized protein [Rutidosis leptorrhynchoides]|uniref:uncharacterized protein n=1 Tax=Rutidosis leptorrhynchoides TaxID=125765 RepID=UPI003A98FEFD